MKKVVLIKSSTQYNVLRYWTDELAKGFEKQGVDVVILDAKYCVKEQIYYILGLDVDAIISFNGLYLEYKELSEYIKVPYIYLLIDHPIDHIVRLNNLQSKDILTIMDRNDINSIEILGLPSVNTYMLPHAALELSFDKVEKEIDILVCGTYSDFNVYQNYLESQTPTLVNVCRLVIEQCFGDSNIYYYDAFINEFKNKGIDAKKLLSENMPFVEILRNVGYYIYSIQRLRVITRLAEAECNIHIYGDKWDKSPLVNFPNVHINNSIDFWELQRVMRKSKIVLNFQPLLKDGTHERVFVGMSNYSVVVTNVTPYLKELFQSDEEIIFYNFNNLDIMVEKVKSILEDNTLRNEIADAALKAVKGKHTFEERAKEIITIYHDVYGNNL
ncbi:hypothetical protein C3943_04185 [Lysinibacillus sp. B2A1]|nr:hypothetical protein C3943_04185 [Lysinibacillus sp. B2A1]